MTTTPAGSPHDPNSSSGLPSAGGPMRRPAAPAGSGPMPGGAQGASAERTRLAWRRTALATTLIMLLTIRLALTDGRSAPDGLAIAAAALGWIGALWVIQRRIHAMATTEPRHIGRTLPAIGLMTVGFAVLGIALVLAAG